MANGRLTLTLDKQTYNELKGKLKKLEEVDQSAAVQKGLREGVKPIIAQGKSNLASRNKVRKGKLSHSFGTALKKKYSAIKAGFRRPGGAASHLVDRGTVKRWTRKGYYRGSVSKGNPKHGSLFWTSAVDEKGQEALNILAEAINREIEKIYNQ